MFNLNVQILGVTAPKRVSIAGSATVSEIFKMADIDLSGNYLIKLDGQVVHPDTVVSSGSMLVASQQIKGN